MTDNTVINAGSGGDTISTDDIGGVKVQRVKAQWGPDGTGTDVDVASGLPVQSGWKELTGSASANNADLVTADVSGYRWVSVQITGTFSSNVLFQQSNDGTNWLSLVLFSATGTTFSSNTSTSTTGAMWAGPITSRYIRFRTGAYSSGTPAVVVELSATSSANAGGSTVSVSNSVTVIGGTSSADGTSSPGVLNVAAFPSGYNGATWDRLRIPNTFKTVSTQASGSTAVWTPTAGKKFRLMRYKLSVTQDAATSGGADITLTFVDNVTNTTIIETVFIPATAATTMGSGWTSGWTDLGNGVLSASINQVLSISLSAALTSGAVRVLVAGCEE